MVIEVLRFRLAAGVGDAAFLDADRRVQTELVPNQTGFLRRTTARSDDGEWLVLTLWASAGEADASAAASVEHPAGMAFVASVDGATAEERRYATLD